VLLGRDADPSPLSSAEV